MKPSITVTIVLGWLCTLPGQAQSTTEPGANMIRSEAKRVEHEAKTPAQFKALADYYRQRADKFNAKATEEKLEWQRRSQNTYSLYAKPQRPADAARNLYEYYQLEVNQAAESVARYEKSAEGRTAPDEQVSSK